MTLPAFIFGFLISTLIGAAFHLILGGGAGRLLLYLILGWTGFWIGHYVANLISFRFAAVGPMNLGLAVVGSLLFLGVGYWLSLVQVDQN
ncbi:MAG: hypothetical protein DWQ07_00185 [Chloroflexi bacterium]|nr:MAG: hypothetical protein DWQ07_00185 [Chloroflexota bacterium]MBL1196020.1 hypothetical protein [Chloroflexota bacterium]NOH13314.1 hypothetical protein [Chloroflexota bacterium]